ncbi:conjugal transfer protein TrbH [Phyllobacterium sp. YR531]|uniref:conjugal transfer protein TrbH n=1 Tax=Phyllobacterium sp. YR531 TaxID=1144343 RepID=UPI00026FBA5E|nr:conjugal transfer protein TrbH [Phyllobacterium sp. YR531]EJN06759.1 Conjugal transfer protein TrbH [Phyllobacterium sp. YR531]
MRSHSPVRTIAIAGFLTLVFSGCQSLGPEGLVTSNASPEISGPAASAIAGDMVSRLAEQIGPGTATVALKQDNTPFGKALEAALKGWGYAVVTDQKTDGKTKLISLAYVIESFEGQMLARLSTTRIQIGRAYSVTTEGATPASPLSVMQRG